MPVSGIHTPSSAQGEILHLSPTITEANLLRSMGVPAGQSVKKRLSRLIAETIPFIKETAIPKLAWTLGNTIHIKQLLSESLRLKRYLKSPEYTALVVGTAGTEWEEFVSRENDPMKAFIYAAAATALARDTLVKARLELSHRHPQFTIGDTLSPGTDGLPFTLQADFARILPIRSIGVQFDRESFFMQPLASVTAVIGFGNAVERDEPIPQCGDAHSRCHRCPDRNCRLRTAPYANARKPDQLADTFIS